MTLWASAHRCAVVGNPGIFLANSFEGVLEGVRKSGGCRVLLHFYVEVFQKYF
jgi:hypothetical protein